MKKKKLKKSCKTISFLAETVMLVWLIFYVLDDTVLANIFNRAIRKFEGLKCKSYTQKRSDVVFSNHFIQLHNTSTRKCRNLCLYSIFFSIVFNFQFFMVPFLFATLFQFLTLFKNWNLYIIGALIF